MDILLISLFSALSIIVIVLSTYIYEECIWKNDNIALWKSIRFTKNDAEKIMTRARQKEIDTKYIWIIGSIQNAANARQSYAVINICDISNNAADFLKRRLEKQGFFVKCASGDFIISWNE